MVRHAKYTDYLTDSQFIRWQLMPDEDSIAYWDEYLERFPDSAKEIQHAITYLKKEGLNKSGLGEFEQQQLLEKIQHTIRLAEQKKRRKITWYSTVASAAVAAVIIAISFLLPSREITIGPVEELIVGELLGSEDIQLITSGESISFQNDISVTLDGEGIAEIVQSNSESSKVEIARDRFSSLVVPYGKRTTLTLSDGSRVWLNSGSVLEFPAQFSGKGREIRLTSGEMYIEVTHDEKRPFHVQTAQFNVRVYGTKFNLSTYSGTPHSIVLAEGSVGLQSGNNKELLLKPDQQAIYSESGIFETRVVDANRFISWKDGYLAFDKTPMTEVLRQVGRYYNLSFDFENDVNLQNRTCTGKIYLSENLDNVMATIGFLTSTRYKKQENNIYITNK
jgi:hypothetical protein